MRPRNKSTGRARRVSADEDNKTIQVLLDRDEALRIGAALVNAVSRGGDGINFWIGREDLRTYVHWEEDKG